MKAATEHTANLRTALAQARRLLAQDPALAAEQAQEILRVVPEHPPALLLLAQAQLARGDIAGALQIAEDLASAQPNWAEGQLLLGSMLGRAGHGDRAIAALKRAVALKPDLPGAWRSLGDHLGTTGDKEGAAQAYANHIRYSTRDPILLNAATALCENRIPEAEAQLRAHLKKAPTDVAAIRMLAEVAARLNRHDDAEHLLERCLELAPGFNEARQNYALVLHRANQPERALAEVQTLLGIDPGNPSNRNLKAVLLCRIGDYPSALAIYEKILAEYPQQPKIWLSFGHALKTAGVADRAIAAYRTCTQLQADFGEAWWSLANLKTFRFSDDDLAVMRRQRGQPALAVEHQLHFDFAIGKALEDVGDFAAAFSHYQQGNALRRKLVPYSADETSARVRRSKQLFDSEFFRERAGFGARAIDPIFIVGLPRSGSTLVEQILSSHSAVEGTMELPEIISMARMLRGQAQAEPTSGMPYYDALAALDAAGCQALGEHYLQHTRIHRKSTLPHFVDKMPNNFAHIALIHLALPKSRIVDVRRHPLACCFSGFKQQFARGQNFSYDLDDLGRYYRDYVELMAHYDAVLPGRIHRVIYERLVEDTEHEVRRLLDYCALPFEPQCLRFFENDRPVRTASSEQVRQPINRQGLDQWRHFDPWLGPLRSALGPLLDAYPAVLDGQRIKGSIGTDAE